MALWVSLTNWNGTVDPFGGGQDAEFVGAKNYTDLFAKDGLTRTNFMQSIGNTFWYVLFVVPLQTALALGLALLVNNRLLKGKSFFRTAFYFPSVTSSIAISTVFLFLFSSTGAVNALLELVGIDGPNWFSDDRGPAPPRCFSAVGVGTTPAGASTTSSAAPSGTGCPGRRSPCASSSSWSCGPRRAPSC